MRKQKKYIIVIIVILLSITIWFALPFIKVEGYTYPATVVSKLDYNKIKVAYIHADDNEEIEVSINDGNVWNLIEVGKTYLLSYNRKIFHNEYDLDQILPMDKLPTK